MRGIVHGIVRGAVRRKPKEDSATHDKPPGLSALSEDEVRNIFWHACNPLEPRVALAFSSASRELWALTLAQRLQLRSNHQSAAALCRKVDKRWRHFSQARSCKELREATKIESVRPSAADLAVLGTLSRVLPALEEMHLSAAAGSGALGVYTASERYTRLFPARGTAGLDGVPRLVAGLGAGALPAVTTLAIYHLHVGDAGASALAAALGRGALPRLEKLTLCNAAIGNAGLVALAAALRRRSTLISLRLMNNPLGDEGLAAIAAEAPGSTWPPKGGLPKLKELNLEDTQITDVGCATLISAFASGTLPALQKLVLRGIPARAAAQHAVRDVSYECRVYVGDRRYL